MILIVYLYVSQANSSLLLLLLLFFFFQIHLRWHYWTLYKIQSIANICSMNLHFFVLVDRELILWLLGHNCLQSSVMDFLLFSFFSVCTLLVLNSVLSHAYVNSIRGVEMMWPVSVPVSVSVRAPINWLDQVILAQAKINKCLRSTQSHVISVSWKVHAIIK